MSGYGAKEARINRERSARVNLCGDCGCEISETELLCHACETRWESVEEHTDDAGL
jgi:succinate dehydrogenase/fumarate reductase-like Fe-S protein